MKRDDGYAYPAGRGSQRFGSASSTTDWPADATRQTALAKRAWGDLDIAVMLGLADEPQEAQS